MFAMYLAITIVGAIIAAAGLWSQGRLRKRADEPRRAAMLLSTGTAFMGAVLLATGLYGLIYRG